MPATDDAVYTVNDKTANSIVNAVHTVIQRHLRQHPGDEGTVQAALLYWLSQGHQLGKHKCGHSECITATGQMVSAVLSLSSCKHVPKGAG